MPLPYAHLRPKNSVLGGTSRIPFYTGARIAETVRLDTRDLGISRQHGVLRIRSNGERIRDVPIHTKLRDDIHLWLEDRPNWPGADINPALFLNRRGGRLSVRGARDVIAGITDAAGLAADATAHVLLHTFAANLVGGGTDLVVVADLLGHARLETTRGYATPTPKDPVGPSTCFRPLLTKTATEGPTQPCHTGQQLRGTLTSATCTIMAGSGPRAAPESDRGRGSTEGVRSRHTECRTAPRSAARPRGVHDLLAVVARYREHCVARADLVARGSLVVLLDAGGVHLEFHGVTLA